MTCHYCDGLGYTIHGDCSGTWEEPCPVCDEADDETPPPRS